MSKNISWLTIVGLMHYSASFELPNFYVSYTVSERHSELTSGCDCCLRPRPSLHRRRGCSGSILPRKAAMAGILLEAWCLQSILGGRGLRVSRTTAGLMTECITSAWAVLPTARAKSRQEIWSAQGRTPD